ncbi:SLC13 family permease [Flintibacter sp. KGMB00164]|uniref:SLC13 family permease n=1 Tax=Flintibacter sp. KGMB00164 TaxID=2610895 RepID=UPI0012463F67|nr:SLC13 family permease [Flintibacter sp. KGMB00164]
MLGIISLIVLFVIVALGFIRKANVGLLAIAAAAILAYASGEYTSKEVTAGFSASLLMTLLGVTLFFGIVQSNGCLELLMKKIVVKFDRQVWFVPILIYAVGWTMSAVGPGCVPTLAFVATLSIPLAHQTGYNPIMLMMIGDLATYSGRYTSITPEGILVSKLMSEQGIENVLTPMIINTFIGSVILSVIVFIFYKGYKVKKPEAMTGMSDNEVFTGKQIIALVSILIMLCGVIFLSMDVGLASFILSAVLILVGIGDQKAALKNVPWNTILLVCGVGVLMNLVIGSGGIDLLASLMSSIMSANTAAPIAGIAAGCMSWFSSTMGVVLPTLLPTVGGIVESVPGASAVEIISTIGIVSACAGFSPASTVGAIIMGAIDGDEIFSKQKDSNKLFVELFAWSVFCVLFLALLAFLGIFGIVK